MNINTNFFLDKKARYLINNFFIVLLLLYPLYLSCLTTYQMVKGDFYVTEKETVADGIVQKIHMNGNTRYLTIDDKSYSVDVDTYHNTRVGEKVALQRESEILMSQVLKVSLAVTLWFGIVFCIIYALVEFFGLYLNWLKTGNFGRK